MRGHHVPIRAGRTGSTRTEFAGQTGHVGDRIDEIGELDGWICWLCGSPVARDDRSGGPWAATVDHVVPRSRRGRTETDNLRLAHARCNRRRGSADPTIEWPGDLPVSAMAPLFSAGRRLAERGGSEIVAVADDTTAQVAAAWLTERLGHVFRTEWTVHLDPTGGSAETVFLRLEARGRSSATRTRSSSSSRGRRRSRRS